MYRERDLEELLVVITGRDIQLGMNNLQLDVKDLDKKIKIPVGVIVEVSFMMVEEFHSVVGENIQVSTLQ